MVGQVGAPWRRRQRLRSLLGDIVGLAQMLHDPVHTAGPRTGVHLTRIRTHACAPYDLLAAHYQSLSIGMPTNTSIDLPVTHQGVMCQVRHTHRLRNCSGKATDMRWISLAFRFANWDDRMIPEVCLAHCIAGVV